jgi:hexosaminidase
MFPTSRSLLSLLVATLLSGTVVVEALWPRPQISTSSSGALRLSKSFQIKTSGQISSDLKDAISRTEWYLKNDNLGRLVLGRGSGDVSVVNGSSWLQTLNLSFGKNAQADSITNETRTPLGSRDEAYHLYVPADGSAATLSANSSLGLFRGLTTFSQLWYTYDGTIYALGVPMDIQDYPAYVCDTAGFHYPQEMIVIVALPWTHVGHGTELLPCCGHHASNRRDELGQGLLKFFVAMLSH